ncbi:MAG: hypothetical protein J6S23_04025 [Clostridia bacterium]|nr:hypothetical protein [Clostridia bacterium]
MTDHKFTDDVIKALECCTNCICNHAKTDTECPLVKMDFCKNYLMKQSLTLINRQKAEIERLESLTEQLGNDVDVKLKYIYELEEQLKTAKVEAIKEFAERLKSRLIIYTYINFNDVIDSLVKEMTEELK